MEDTGGGGVSTVEHGGMTITSIGTSTAEVKASLAATEEKSPAPETEGKPDKQAKRTISDSARDLGKRGGKAAAEKRAEAAAAAPEEKPPAEADAKAPEGDGAEGGEEADDAEDKLSDRARRRIEVATRKQAEARRELETERQARAQERARYEAELAAHRVNRPGEGPKGADARTPPRTSAPDVQGHDAQDEPRMEDFDDFQEFMRAHGRWNRKEWTREQQRQQYATAAVNTVIEHVNEFIQASKAINPAHIDPELLEAKPYFELADGEAPGPYTGLITEAFRLKGEGPGVLRYLSDNLDELQRLRALTSQEDLRVEMRVIAKTLGSRADATAGEPPASGDRAPKRETSKANPPVRPVTGAPHVAEGDAGPREGEEFDSWYRRQKRA